MERSFKDSIRTCKTTECPTSINMKSSFMVVRELARGKQRRIKQAIFMFTCHLKNEKH